MDNTIQSKKKVSGGVCEVRISSGIIFHSNRATNPGVLQSSIYIYASKIFAQCKMWFFKKYSET